MRLLQLEYSRKDNHDRNCDSILVIITYHLMIFLIDNCFSMLWPSKFFFFKLLLLIIHGTNISSIYNTLSWFNIAPLLETFANNEQNQWSFQKMKTVHLKFPTWITLQDSSSSGNTKTGDLTTSTQSMSHYSLGLLFSLISQSSEFSAYMYQWSYEKRLGVRLKVM